MVKGEIWWANLPETPYGSEPGKNRPVVIIQNDLLNRSDLNTVIVVSITSNMKLAKMPGNITLEKGVSGLDKQSVISFSQISTIDKTRLTELVSMLPKNIIQKINESMRYIFDN